VYAEIVEWHVAKRVEFPVNFERAVKPPFNPEYEAI
jgi:hypothetical protein